MTVPAEAKKKKSFVNSKSSIREVEIQTVDDEEVIKLKDNLNKL